MTVYISAFVVLSLYKYAITVNIAIFISTLIFFRLWGDSIFNFWAYHRIHCVAFSIISFFLGTTRLKWSIEQPYYLLLTAFHSIYHWIAHLQFRRNGHFRHCWEILPSAINGADPRVTHAHTVSKLAGRRLNEMGREWEPRGLLWATEFNLHRINTPLFKDTR